MICKARNQPSKFMIKTKNDDIKVGDRVVFIDERYFDAAQIGQVHEIGRGLFFKRFVILDRDPKLGVPGDVIRMWKKYRWQLFKINS